MNGRNIVQVVAEYFKNQIPDSFSKPVFYKCILKAADEKNRDKVTLYNNITLISLEYIGELFIREYIRLINAYGFGLNDGTKLDGELYNLAKKVGCRAKLPSGIKNEYINEAVKLINGTLIYKFRNECKIFNFYDESFNVLYVSDKIMEKEYKTIRNKVKFIGVNKDIKDFLFAMSKPMQLAADYQIVLKLS